MRDLALKQPLELVPLTRERAAQAGRLVCKTCSQQGVKVSSWQEFESLQSYVEGKIDEGQLAEEARKELERHSETFGKYLLMEEESPGSKIADEEKRKRAKRATRIYRNVCRNLGLSLCFFSSFSAWSDFVEGRIDELEFLGRVGAEAEKMGNMPGTEGVRQVSDPVESTIRDERNTDS